MEVAHVRNRLKIAIDGARQRAQARRARVADAEGAFETFVTMATPLLKQLANALRVEGQAFTLFTPEHGPRLASDRSRVDFIELTLDVSGEQPCVMARVSCSRGSRTVDEERALKPGTLPDALAEDDILAFLLDALEPWLGKS